MLRDGMTLLFRATIHYRTCLQRMIYCLHSKVSEANQRLKAWSFFRFATTIRFWRQSPPECCLGRLKTRVVRGFIFRLGIGPIRVRCIGLTCIFFVKLILVGRQRVSSQLIGRDVEMKYLPSWLERVLTRLDGFSRKKPVTTNQLLLPG